MIEDFSKNIVKEYTYWDLYVHPNQCYLGKCLVCCKREDALDLPDATKEEREELFQILRELEKTYEKTFKPDILNYSFLGNVTHHLHGHIVPRHSKEKEFDGVTFKDPLWGHNYWTDKDFVIPEVTLQKIKETLQKAL